LKFEELWEKCEQALPEEDTESICQEIDLKLKLLQKINSAQNVDPKDMHGMKSRVIGDLLLSFTKLSRRENVNVFAALGQALAIKLGN
jgi:hypothetical protein